ncbi:MAG TPA: type II toxin-antitoxin system VapB family antitoxin [Candidatus Binatia bacterium]|nr:type II toxin-antitoxin system VapB family antitoxin [Candidatus Binatia bacterium]
MALNIKNNEVERLVDEVANLTGESKTEAVRRALEERKARLVLHIAGDHRSVGLKGFLERELWPLVPPQELGRRLSRAEEEAILVYGETGV